jgi:hypothetical protein
MLDTSEALVAARRPFMLDNQEALPLGDGCYLQRVALNQRPKVLRIGGQSVALATRPRRRLGLCGAEIANGQQARLFGPDAVIRVETGLQTTETRRLRLSVVGVEKVIDVSIAEGLGECTLADCLPPGLPPGPARLRLELLAPDREARSAGITLGAFVWPGFERANGLDLICSAAPANFLPSHSQHVTAFERGLQLDPKGGYAHATAAFGIEGEVVSFRLAWPDISLQRLRSDGVVSPVPLGARIGVGVEDRFGHVAIRCPDRGAALRVGARHEAQPFVLGMTRNIAISELMGSMRRLCCSGRTAPKWCCSRSWTRFSPSGLTCVRGGSGCKPPSPLARPSTLSRLRPRTRWATAAFTRSPLEGGPCGRRRPIGCVPSFPALISAKWRLLSCSGLPVRV